ncbi:ABC transporter substrate-binding protein [Acidisphaera sp. S103]|uniref:ABC transporter substrate-binding protein n=1 Tax=Acidisphaera sp. S103 TaxID=1747223 RepID=UPI00131B58CF|nr:ABC transporter substrate-binding protein [Acidisphaera sp. S103]
MHMLRYRRRGLFAATAAALLCSALPVRAADDQAAIAPIQQLIGGLEQVMKAGMGASFSQRFAMLAPIVDRTFDLTAILRESVGAPWASLPPNQQAMLADAFRRYTVATYVNSFDSSDGTRFEVKPETRAVGNQQVVQTKIIPKSGDSHELDYVMRDGGSGWRAVDILADGSISRVAVQRSDFRRLLARGGAEALVASLKSKSADLSDGSS